MAKGRWRPTRRRTSGWAGGVYLRDRELILDFEYSAERVRLLKSIGQAKFSKKEKYWTLPTAKYSHLRKIELFSPDIIRYYFEEIDLELTEAERLAKSLAAQKTVQSNPFQVPSKSLQLVPVDVEFTFKEQRNIFVIREKFKSKAARVLKQFPGLLPSEREKGLIIQAHSITNLIKKLRDEGISFAVEEKAGQVLSATAELRAEVLSGGKRPDADDLLGSLLLPFITSSADDSLMLVGWTPEQLKLFFPNADTFPERKKKSAQLCSEDLSLMLSNANSAGISVWLDRNVSKRVQNLTGIETKRATGVSVEKLKRNEHFQKLKDLPLDTRAFSVSNIGENLFPHQRVAVNWLAENPRALLGDDMGLGKTLSVLSYFEKLFVEQEADLLLVVCPNSLKRNWIREGQNWFPKRKLLMLPESKKDRPTFFRQLRYGAQLCEGIVVNFESLRLPDVLTEVTNILEARKALLCVDESQRVKNPKGKTFKSLTTLAPLCQRRVLLSGTPVPRDLSDIWAQVFLLDDGERFGKNFYRWLTQVAELGNKYSEFAIRKFKPTEAEHVIKRTQELLLRRKKEEVLSLPGKIFSIRDVELIGDQKKFYEEVRKELLLRVTSITGATYLKEIQNILEEYLRAVQIASNPRLVDSQWAGEPAKFLECDELVEEIAGEQEKKIVIWTNYLVNVSELVERYKKYGSRAFSGEVSTADRDKTIKQFQEDNTIKVLVAVPAAGGLGITLTAAQTAVYLDKTWNAEHYLQSVDRIHRIGQHSTVNIVSLQACKVDELIAKNLAQKEQLLRKLLGDEVKEMSNLSREELLDAVRA